MSKKIFKLDHPGKLLAQTIKELGVSQYRFAKVSGIGRTALRSICAGRRRISAENAIRIALTLKTDAQSWLNMQTKFDLWEAERRDKKYLTIQPLEEVQIFLNRSQAS